jgi:hypothetical protein
LQYFFLKDFQATEEASSPPKQEISLGNSFFMGHFALLCGILKMIPNSDPDT